MGRESSFFKQLSVPVIYFKKLQYIQGYVCNMQENKNGVASGENGGVEGDGLRIHLCLDTGKWLVLRLGSHE